MPWDKRCNPTTQSHLMNPTPLIASLILALAMGANAGTHVWSGAGANSSWSTAANWSSGGVPSSVESAPVKIVFPSTAVAFTSTLNISNLKIDVIEINVGSSAQYTFPNAGISTTLTGAAGDNMVVIGTGGNVVWQPGLNVQATSRFNVQTNPVTLDIQGVVVGAGGVTKTGGGTLKFSTSSAANTFTGPLRMEAGLILLNKVAGTPCLGGDLEVVSGSVQVLRSHQIPDTADILMAGGNLHFVRDVGVATVSETVGNIIVSGASNIRIGPSCTLVLGGNISCENTATSDITFQVDSGGQISLGGASRTFSTSHIDSSIFLQGPVVDG